LADRPRNIEANGGREHSRNSASPEKGLSPNPNYGNERETRFLHGEALEPEGGAEMGETVEVIISIVFFGGWLFFLSWAWGRVGYKLGYSFWAFALTFGVILFAIISILLLGLKMLEALHIYVGNETLELIIGISYYGGFFLLCGCLWGRIARKLGHSFWIHAFTFWLGPITIIILVVWRHAFIFFLVPIITLLMPAISLLYLGFRRGKKQTSMDSAPEESSTDSA
jgi:hypothetical protein